MEVEEDMLAFRPSPTLHTHLFSSLAQALAWLGKRPSCVHSKQHKTGCRTRKVSTGCVPVPVPYPMRPSDSPPQPAPGLAVPADPWALAPSPGKEPAPGVLDTAPPQDRPGERGSQWAPRTPAPQHSLFSHVEEWPRETVTPRDVAVTSCAERQGGDVVTCTDLKSR